MALFAGRCSNFKDKTGFFLVYKLKPINYCIAAKKIYAFKHI